MRYDRRDEQGAAVALHEPHQGQGYEARDDSEAVAVVAGLPLPQARKASAGNARHRATQVWHRHLHPRLLLARS